MAQSLSEYQRWYMPESGDTSERILAEVDNEGHCPRLRDLGKPRILDRKVDLPVSVAEGVEAARVVKVEDLLPLTGALATEQVAYVMGVEVDFVCHVARLVALQEAFRSEFTSLDMLCFPQRGEVVTATFPAGVPRASLAASTQRNPR